MIVFIKRGPYDRRELIDLCFNRYIDCVGEKGGTSQTVAGVNNKPYFKDRPDVRFSISHSGDIVLLAMGRTEIGIDIEKIRPLDYKSLAERYYTGGEKQKASTLEGYFEVWTAKEAYLKLTAEGLGGIGKYDTTAPLTYNGEKTVFTPVDVFEGYKCTIAAPEQEIIFSEIF